MSYGGSGSGIPGIGAQASPAAGRQLIAKCIITTAQTNIIFDNIPQNFINLRLTGLLRTNGAGVVRDDILLRLNGDTTANYYTQYWGVSNSASAVGGSIAATAASYFGMGWQNGSGAGLFGSLDAYLPAYSYPGVNKTWDSTVTTCGSTSAASSYKLTGVWGTKDPIRKIQLVPNVGTGFVAGSFVYLYGER